jgi:predicted amidohydrolase
MLMIAPVVGVFGTPVAAASEPLNVVLVQYQVRARDYASLESFRDRVAGIVSDALQASDPKLIVFPEYISVFGLFADLITEDGEILLNEISPEVAALLSSDEYSDEYVDAPPAAVGELRRLVRRRAARYGPRINEVWSSVAAEYGVWIVAGSGFVPASGGGVYNRAWVFDSTGEVAYYQDKVYLTHFERANLGVVPGSVGDADIFAVDGIDLALTICRDSYFDAWEGEFSLADAWIDVRANGEPYSPAVRERFETALPERVAETPVPLGLSTSLNGRFLDLLWQGPAFVVDDDGQRVAQSPTVDGDYLMEVTVRDAISGAADDEEKSVD